MIRVVLKVTRYVYDQDFLSDPADVDPAIYGDPFPTGEYDECHLYESDTLSLGQLTAVVELLAQSMRENERGIHATVVIPVDHYCDLTIP